MSLTNPRILIGSPTAAPYAYCLSDWIAGVQALTYSNTTSLLVDNTKDSDYAAVIRSKGMNAVSYVIPKGETIRETLAHSRNLFRDKVLSEDYDYFLSLEQDIVPPVDVIERLLSHKQPVVSAVYYKYFTLKHTSKEGKVLTKQKAMPLLAKASQDPTKMHFLTAEEVEGDHVLPLRYCGLGCVLIHRSVLEKIKFRVDMGPEGRAFDDVYFCNDVLAAEFPLYVDTSIKCLHRLSGKPSGLFAEVDKLIS